MEWKQPYFLWNNKETFRRGWGRNIYISEASIHLEEGRETGNYYTRVCDSRQTSMEWDRMRIEGEIPYPEDVRITVYTCDSDSIMVGNNRYGLLDFIKDSSISMEQKGRLLDSCKQQELIYEKNHSLQGIRGRYFFMRLDINRSGKNVPQIHRIQVWFPKVSWTSFLPELYQMQEDTFLERFLGIVRTMYEDMNRTIEAIPGLYYAETTPSGMLVWLSQWLSIPEPYLWKEEQLRYLIRQGSLLAGRRGTASYLKEILGLYTGQVPYIIEYWQWAYVPMDSRRRKALETLYGSDSFCITLVFSVEIMQNRISPGVIERLVECSSPAHLDVRIEILQPYMFLGRHSYLGMNSYLTDWGTAVLDGQQFLPFVVLKEKEKQYEGSELFSF